MYSDDDSLRNFLLSTIDDTDEDEAVDETYEPDLEEEDNELSEDDETEGGDDVDEQEQKRVDARELQALLRDASSAIPGSAPPLTTTLQLASFRSDVATPRALELLSKRVKEQLASHVQLLVQTMLLSSGDGNDLSLSAPYGQSCGMLLELGAHAIEARRTAVVREEMRLLAEEQEPVVTGDTVCRLTRLKLQAARRKELTLDEFGGTKFGDMESFESIFNAVQNTPTVSRARAAFEIVENHGIKGREALLLPSNNKQQPALQQPVQPFALMSFTASEDALLLRGVQLYGGGPRFGEIQETMLPPKSRELLMFRYASLTADTAPPNSLKEHQAQAARAGSMTTRDQEDKLLALGVLQAGFPGPADLTIAAKLLPHRAKSNLQKRWKQIEASWHKDLTARALRGADHVQAEILRASAAYDKAARRPCDTPTIWDEHLPSRKQQQQTRPVAPAALLPATAEPKESTTQLVIEQQPEREESASFNGLICSDATRDVFDVFGVYDDDHDNNHHEAAASKDDVGDNAMTHTYAPRIQQRSEAKSEAKSRRGVLDATAASKAGPPVVLPESHSKKYRQAAAEAKAEAKAERSKAEAKAERKRKKQQEEVQPVVAAAVVVEEEEEVPFAVPWDQSSSGPLSLLNNVTTSAMAEPTEKPKSRRRKKAAEAKPKSAEAKLTRRRKAAAAVVGAPPKRRQTKKPAEEPQAAEDHHGSSLGASSSSLSRLATVERSFSSPPRPHTGVAVEEDDPAPLEDDDDPLLLGMMLGNTQFGDLMSLALVSSSDGFDLGSPNRNLSLRSASNHPQSPAPNNTTTVMLSSSSPGGATTPKRQQQQHRKRRGSPPNGCSPGLISPGPPREPNTPTVPLDMDEGGSKESSPAHRRRRTDNDDEEEEQKTSSSREKMPPPPPQLKPAKAAKPSSSSSSFFQSVMKVSKLGQS